MRISRIHYLKCFYSLLVVDAVVDFSPSDFVMRA